MNISSREKRLLIIVLSVAVGVLYYSFPFKSNKTELENKVNEKKQIVSQYEDELREIDQIESRKVTLEENKKTAVEKADGYYPEIIQEKLIKEVDALMTKNNLTGDYSWAEANANVVENLTPGILALPESTTKTLADTIKKSLEEGTTQSIGSDNTSTTTAEVESDGTASPVQMVLAINFKGTYDSLKTFVDDIKSYDRVISASALTTSWQSESELSGTINIEFYSIPKINDDDNSYLNWN